MFKTVFGVLQVGYAVFLYYYMLHIAGQREVPNLYSIWVIVWIFLAVVLFGRGIYNALWLLPTDKEFHYSHTQFTVSGGVGSARNVFQSQHSKLSGALSVSALFGAIYYAFVSINDARSYAGFLESPLMRMYDLITQLWTQLLFALFNAIFA